MRIAQFLLLALVAAPIAAQTPTPTGVLDGAVTGESLAPLGGATVSILGTTVRVVTGDNGRFVITSLPPREYIVVVHRVGYKPVSATVQVAAHDTLRMSFTLDPIANALDTVVVTEKALDWRIAEFEERRKLGAGHFITRDDIEKQHALWNADLLQTVLSVKVTGRAGIQYAVNTRGMCPFAIYLDGALVRGPVNLNDLPPPTDLAGIEIYTGPSTTPLQYKERDAGCGVMLFWTKVGG